MAFPRQPGGWRGRVLQGFRFFRPPSGGRKKPQPPTTRVGGCALPPANAFGHQQRYVLPLPGNHNRMCLRYSRTRTTHLIRSRIQCLAIKITQRAARLYRSAAH